MGNHKNKNNKRDSAHLHIYRQKNNPKKIKLDRQTDSSTQQEESRVSIEGSRIINVDKLQVYIDDLTKHSLHCGGSIVLCGERRDGLASILSSQCSSCQHTITLETSKKVKGPRGYQR